MISKSAIPLSIFRGSIKYGQILSLVKSMERAYLEYVHHGLFYLAVNKLITGKTQRSSFI